MLLKYTSENASLTTIHKLYLTILFFCKKHFWVNDLACMLTLKQWVAGMETKKVWDRDLIPNHFYYILVDSISENTFELIATFFFNQKKIKIWHGIILLNKLNICGKLMWHLTENMDERIANENGIKFQEVKSKF